MSIIHKELHVKYIQQLNTQPDHLEHWLTEHLRLNGIYWGITALTLLDRIDALPRDEIIKFVLSCFDENSGTFAPYPGHDGHMLATLSGVQILAIYDSIDSLTNEQIESIVKFVVTNQLEDGSFQGDQFGEVDTRFIYNGLATLKLLGRLTDNIVDSAVDYIKRCRNFDGGYGLCIGAESHSAQVFTCLGALALTGKLDTILTKDEQEQTAWWLCERQVNEGGFNGRPSKLPDACYSWWVGASLAILGKIDWINGDDLEKFLLKCQDEERGGFSDRPGNETDVFHTIFSLAGLSLVGKQDLMPIDPKYCLPPSVTCKL
ncbi:hypothetical protein TBLA_0E00790 [Henningerozyma blattae CBS 6284]|uniref:Geranylgeranyl transferase type-2 subunit beta n=1 Tax=Henningerozyma blattae (strain ATCC 34711 / CBS 6284 / DSM 70876 / NBRC 10599 / NRRL Y-10934 / UCD 77-7) TaxID=1071380 RepID=I2H438_HENB6|nr:hypothetical protein TBLA_0E00790 [Tetrapisispora blattae CBS 6284]CCH61140.1 hypothetical protein TBLA_0E00790 [Tetrapisispora blattae CBS 6284]